MKKYFLIYNVKEQKELIEKKRLYIEMKIISENEFNKLHNKFLFEISAEVYGKSDKEALNYFRDLFKYNDEIRI